MSAQTFQVTLSSSYQSLATLLQALSGWPTQQSLGVTTPMPVGTASQLTLNNDSANAVNIQYKSTGTAAGVGGTIVPGGSENMGLGLSPVVDLGLILVKGASGTPLLNITRIN